ncbi:MAG: enoyl-CoA hydratase/isomerase family protein [Bacteroidetes bacterium]|nr:enoyl-CoA hydratase/isomerase family protein [Bacteroidota bacterium]
MEKIKVNYNFNNSVAQIILDDGKGNILDSVMMNELTALLEQFKFNTNLKLITFEGAGKHYSFGASVEEHKKEKAAAMLKSFHNLFYLLIDLSIPTISKVSGQCLGGGMELAIMCNLIFADNTAKFGQPEIILGVFPPPASLILPQKIGLAQAEELLVTGKTINAQQAKSYRIVNELYETRDELENGLNEFIEKQILPKSSSSLQFAVKASRKVFNKILLENLPQLEEMYINQLMNTNDANEGITSFLEKRQPEWKGF